MKERVEFLCLQETQVSFVDKRLACVLWGSNDCDWVFSGSDGASGGLCCIWDPNIFVRKAIWGEKGLLGVEGLWDGVHVNIVNVYASCKAVEKSELWKVIEEKMRGKEDEKWCFCGDFNSIRHISERKGVARRERRKEMVEFNDFIVKMGLIDLPLERRRFTWYKENGNCCSRIDRFLLSNEWANH